jgi:serine/threonine protein kinase
MSAIFVAFEVARANALITHVRVNPKGLALESVFGRSLEYKRFMAWQDISFIHVEDAPPNKGKLAAKLVIKFQSGRETIPLKKIASAVEWRKLVAAVERYSSSQDVVVSLDPTYLDSFVMPTRSDSSYTKLWLSALNAVPRRLRLLPLEAETELQNGKFKITKQLGTGGQGSAYLTIMDGGDQVALKEYILPVYVDKLVRKKAIEDFWQEANTLRNLHNDHIVSMIDSFVEDQRAYLVMEYVQGFSLRQLVQTEGSFSEARCLNLAMQMCEALSYLHGQSPPIVHQDFTPDNLVLDQSGNLKLIDFMIAKRQVDGSITANVVGKHHYMPPEQFRGKATTQSDLYAFGCTMYFLLTGEDPEPMSPAQPQVKNQQVSADLNTFVERATQLDCAKRYGNAAEMKHELERLCSIVQPA